MLAVPAGINADQCRRDIMTDLSAYIAAPFG